MTFTFPNPCMLEIEYIKGSGLLSVPRMTLKIEQKGIKFGVAEKTAK